MSFLSKLFNGASSAPPKRVRICVECGMPVAEHKDWCSIYRTLKALQRKQAAAAATEG